MPTITVGPGTFQTFDIGWMVEVQAGLAWDIDNPSPFVHGSGRNALNPVPSQFLADVIAGSVALGYTAIAIPVHCGWENPTPYWEQFHVDASIPRTGLTGYKQHRRTTVNTNRDASHTLVGGVDLRNEELDYSMMNVVLPFRNGVQVNGETPKLICKYEAFTGLDPMDTQEGEWISNYFHNNSALYARFVWSVYKYIHDTYGFWPDLWEIMIEPDFDNTFYSDINGSGPPLIAAHVKAAGDLLIANGVPSANVKFIAPSTTDPAHVDEYYAAIQALSGAEQYIGPIGYHGYSRTTPVITTIGTLAQSRGKGAMLTELEEFSSVLNGIREDLTVGFNTGWGLGAPMAEINPPPYIAYELNFGAVGNYPGDDYPNIQSAPTMSLQSKLLRQYMQFIRPGAVRTAASSDNGNFVATAFNNSNGKAVVIVEGTAAGVISITGLPANTYGVRYVTTDGFGTTVSLADVTITAGQTLVTASVPVAAWTTIYALNATASSSPLALVLR